MLFYYCEVVNMAVSVCQIIVLAVHQNIWMSNEHHLKGPPTVVCLRLRFTWNKAGICTNQKFEKTFFFSPKFTFLSIQPAISFLLGRRGHWCPYAATRLGTIDQPQLAEVREYRIKTQTNTQWFFPPPIKTTPGPKKNTGWMAAVIGNANMIVKRVKQQRSVKKCGQYFL